MSDKTLATTYQGYGGGQLVNTELFMEFRTSCLSFILNLFGSQHPYYKDFLTTVTEIKHQDTLIGKGILKAIKVEIDGGWLQTFKGLVSSEIFSDFLEMAEHLLKEKYKDPAAVMIGSVLEEHLRQLCVKSGIPINDEKGGKAIPKKADTLNGDLGNLGIYNKLDQKNVTALLDLRNKAAHGKYGDYTQQQVEIMLQSVTDFMTRNAV
ncbi:MAG: hypothetical protein Q8M15_02745 [Bacteroidota bacterium]|nr:hypothetical protein [Bacteroidota bacterium]